MECKKTELLQFYALCTLSTSDRFSAVELLLRKRIEYHDIQDEITNTYDIISEIILVIIGSQKPSKPNWIILIKQNVHPASNNRYNSIQKRYFFWHPWCKLHNLQSKFKSIAFRVYKICRKAIKMKLSISKVLNGRKSYTFMSLISWHEHNKIHDREHP